jgi:hypothetical protein
MYLTRRHILTGASVLGAAPLFGARAQSPQTISVGVLTDLSGTYRDNTARYLPRVKTPVESTSEWDLYKVLSTTPAAKVLHPLLDKCKFAT